MPAGRQSKVMILFQDQQFDEALNYLSPVLKADSDNVPVLNYTGYAYYMSDNTPARRPVTSGCCV